MKTLDMEKIARGLGAERMGQVSARSGFFGTLQIAAEVQARFRAPPKGGRATVPEWTERRLIPLAPGTLRHLEDLATKLKESVGIEPMQLAALLLERMTESINDTEVEQLATKRSGSQR